MEGPSTFVVAAASPFVASDARVHIRGAASTTRATCSGTSNTSGDCRNSVQPLTDNGTTFATLRVERQRGSRAPSTRESLRLDAFKDREFCIPSTQTLP
jgi:hypothetical protein